VVMHWFQEWPVPSGRVRRSFVTFTGRIHAPPGCQKSRARRFGGRRAPAAPEVPPINHPSASPSGLKHELRTPYKSSSDDAGRGRR
jgi:hypothetical protein